MPRADRIVAKKYTSQLRVVPWSYFAVRGKPHFVMWLS